MWKIQRQNRKMADFAHDLVENTVENVEDFLTGKDLQTFLTYIM
jgi:hypothetical protein